MKKLLIFLFSILISFNSYGEWIEIAEVASSGDTFYIDDQTINERGGYVYFWTLQDNVKPDDYGDLSGIAYYEGDCIKKRFKYLSLTFYSQPMGAGNSTTEGVDNQWEYTPPGSIGETLLYYVCDYVK